MESSNKIPPAAQISKVDISDSDIKPEEEEKKENLAIQPPREVRTDGDYLSIAFKELKESLEALAAAETISLTPGQNFILINENQGLQFETFVLQLQYFTNQNYAPAHQLLGILFERGIVCSKDTPCGMLLQMFGTIYHYHKLINSDEESSRGTIDVGMVSEICDQVINNVTNPFTWHFHKGQNLTPYFSQGIEYEKMAMQASGIEARYLTSWALYYYERSAEIQEQFKLEAYYNAGMIFKNGKGLHYSQNDPAEINQRITQAQDYFLQSTQYAPSLYELAQIEFGFCQEASTQLESKEAFDQAFCWLTQTIYGCEFQFGPAYYLLSDLWINGCCAAETNKISIEDYEEIVKLYQAAQKWYKRFDKPNSAINSNIDFLKKIIKMKDDQQKLEIIEKPYYGLFRSKLLKSILAKELQPLMSIILTQYLKEYSKKKAFNFSQNSSETKIKMNNIAKSIIQWPFKTPLKQILRNFIEFNEKQEENQAHQTSPMICQSIKAILVDEDEQWNSKDVKEMLKQIIPFTENLIDDLAYLPMLDIKQEIVGLYKKCNSESIIVKNIEQKISNNLGNCQNEAKSILLNCENTFKMLNYWEKLKLIQSNIYEAIVILKMQIGANVVNELDFLQIVKDQILQKLKIDEYLQNNPDALTDSLKLQIQSAKGIYDYKKEKKLQSYQEAKEQLDSFCQKIFQPQSQNMYIGYDIIRNIIFVEELKTKSFTEVSAINFSQRKMRLSSKNFLEVENSWWEKNEIIKQTFQNDIISLNLKDIQKYCASRMNQFQDAIMKSNVNNEPILNYQYLYNDPLIHFACKEVQAQIEQYEIDATKQVMEFANELKQYFNNAIYQILLEKVQTMLKQIKARLNPEFTLPIEEDTNSDIHEIIQLFEFIANNFGFKFSEDVISPVSIQMMKYFLFFLEKIIKSPEPCEASVAQLLIGLYGRCPDGQMLFFLQLLNQSFLDNNTLQNSQISEMDSKVIMENYQFNLVVSLFFQQLKLFFIQQHLTRDQNSYENYTNLNIYLQLVLQLPFDLTGNFTKLAYPLYSLIEEIHELKSVISIKELMNRFLEGGQVKYLNPLQINKINAFTLKYVVDMFRESLLPPNTLFNKKNVKVENGLIQEHIFAFGIQHNILEQYILSNKDLAGEYLAMMNALDHNLDSKYFKGSKAIELSFSFQNILTDAGILLILSQLGYVKADEAFFTNVKLDWKLE